MLGIGMIYKDCAKAYKSFLTKGPPTQVFLVFKNSWLLQKELGCWRRRLASAQTILAMSMMTVLCPRWLSSPAEEAGMLKEATGLSADYREVRRLRRLLAAAREEATTALAEAGQSPAQSPAQSVGRAPRVQLPSPAIPTTPGTPHPGSQCLLEECSLPVSDDSSAALQDI